MEKDSSIFQQITHPGYLSFLKKAIGVGVQVDLLSQSPQIIKLSFKKRTYYSALDDLPVPRWSSTAITRNKQVTKLILQDAGISTPRGILAQSSNEAIRLFRSQKLSFPLITKPNHGSLAKGVYWDIKTLAELKRGFVYTKKYASKKDAVIVEEFVSGNEYRVQLLDGKVIACALKLPAGVVGDGISTIQDLIIAFNKTRPISYRIRIDNVVRSTLKRSGLSFQSVPTRGTFVKLRHNQNLADGGRRLDHTKKIHPRFKKACEHALSALGKSFGGIDIITPDITKGDAPYWILEVNSLPYFSMHEKPAVEGDGLDISWLILKSFFPNLKNSGKN